MARVLRDKSGSIGETKTPQVASSCANEFRRVHLSAPPMRDGIARSPCASRCLDVDRRQVSATLNPLQFGWVPSRLDGECCNGQGAAVCLRARCRCGGIVARYRASARGGAPAARTVGCQFVLPTTTVVIADATFRWQTLRCEEGELIGNPDDP